MIEFFVILMYWTIDGRKHHEISPNWPTAELCSRDGEKGLKLVEGQGAIGAHFQCVGTKPTPAGVPDFIEQPKVPRRDA